MLKDVRYRFNRNGRLISKRVRWYKMKPIEKVGKPDAGEIMATKWVLAGRAGKLLSYPSDLELLAKL